jgi:predicted MPP superfamily phosphohydrolase
MKLQMTRRKFIKVTACTLFAAGAAFTVDAAAVEPYDIEVTAFPVFQQSAKQSGRQLTVAFMSDFHRSQATSGKIIRQAAALCMEQKPDIILLGGDFITSDAGLAADCADELEELKAPGGVYYVLGNHDYWHGSERVRSALSSKGFVDLTNLNTCIAPGFYLCGIDDYWAGKIDAEKALKGTGAAQKLVFSHNPRIFPAISNSHCVAVCGHTHGGQINIPFVPNPFLMSWKKYVKGWFNEGNSRMYVNRRIGMLTLPFRFRCRPEITVFTLQASLKSDIAL